MEWKIYKLLELDQVWYVEETVNEKLLVDEGRRKRATRGKSGLKCIQNWRASRDTMC